jgi:hypothetical protein
MLTREQYFQIKLNYEKTIKKQTNALAIVSFGLGLAALIYLNWVDKYYDGKTRIAIAVLTFVVFISAVAVLSLRLRKTLLNGGPKCSECGISLYGDSIRIATTTGRCDHCGGKVFR